MKKTDKQKEQIWKQQMFNPFTRWTAHVPCTVCDIMTSVLSQVIARQHIILNGHVSFKQAVEKSK